MAKTEARLTWQLSARRRLSCSEEQIKRGKVCWWKGKVVVTAGCQVIPAKRFHFAKTMSNPKDTATVRTRILAQKQSLGMQQRFRELKNLEGECANADEDSSTFSQHLFFSIRPTTAWGTERLLSDKDKMAKRGKSGSTSSVDSEL